MNRRRFTRLAGMGLGAASGLAGRSVAGTQPRTGGRAGHSADVVVVGAGVFGVWTAYHLCRKGASVILVDAYGPGNSRASSGGETRQIQIDHENPVYVRSGLNAYDWWQALEASASTTLLLATGKLALSTSESLIGGAEALQKRLRSFDVTNVEILGPDELRHRWPQISSDDLAFGVYADGGPSGSTLMARRACAVVGREVEKLGGELRIARCRPHFSSTGAIAGIRQDSGETLTADQYVFACGPWLPGLFPDVLAKRLQVQRRDVLFYGSPAGDQRFAYPNFPCWSVIGSGWYGFPDIEHRGFKAAPYPDHNSIDPDNDERLVSSWQVKRGREFLRHRFPALAEMPVVETRVCQITNSIDENFIVDRHPDADAVWLVGAGSGHGFKHGPTVGEFVAQRVLGEAFDQDYADTFRLKPQLFG